VGLCGARSVVHGHFEDGWLTSALHPLRTLGGRLGNLSPPAHSLVLEQSRAPWEWHARLLQQLVAG
jgi:hypothetical protein